MQSVNRASVCQQGKKRIPHEVVSVVCMHHKAANIHAIEYNELCVTVHAVL